MLSAFYVKLYLLTVPVFFAVDILWLGVVARSFYRRQLGFILSDRVNWTAACVFYLIYIIGIIYFAVRPALIQESWQQAIRLGALYGFFTYATYDLTNLATLEKWPLKIVIVDILWGVFLCAIVAAASFAIGTRMSP
jgi:uncharacterized membrane protein